MALFMRGWRNWQTRTFKVRVGDHTGSIPVLRTRPVILWPVLLFVIPAFADCFSANHLMRRLETMEKQYFIPSAQGKRLIAKGIASLEFVKKALNDGIIVVIAGTTNRYVAEELCGLVGCEFDGSGFYRGITVPAGTKMPTKDGTRDLVIERGRARRDLTIFDAAPMLGKGDLIFKGANALYLPTRTAGILLGTHSGGTVGCAKEAADRTGCRLMIPVGLEKTVAEPISAIAERCNRLTVGLHMFEVDGAAYTEIEALQDLCGAKAEFIAAGGVLGGEGGCYLQVAAEDLSPVDRLLAETREQPFRL